MSGQQETNALGPLGVLCWSLSSLEGDMATPRSHPEERRGTLRWSSACTRRLPPLGVAISSVGAADGLEQLLAVAGRRLGEKISPGTVRLETTQALINRPAKRDAVRSMTNGSSCCCA